MMLNKRKKIINDGLMGFSRGINYHLHNFVSYGMKPISLELMITSKCNARCIMCNIWKSKTDSELSLDQMKNILSSPVLSEVKLVIISGGEPFLRNDLSEIIELCDANLPELEEVMIFSNGIMSDRIFKKTADILKIIRDDVSLRVGISFDGIGEEHDRIRNIRGIHESALRTVQELQKIKDKRLSVQADITIGPYNVDHLREMHEYFNGIVSKVAWFPVILSDGYFKNDENINNLSLNKESRKKIIEFLNYLISKDRPSPSSYYYSKLINLMKTGKRNFPCTGGYRYMQINSDGNVNPCPFAPLHPSFGNVKNGPLDKIWMSKESNMLRRKLRNSPICKKCSSDCDLFSLVREEFFDFTKFVISNPKIMMKIVSRYSN